MMAPAWTRALSSIGRDPFNIISYFISPRKETTEPLFVLFLVSFYLSKYFNKLFFTWLCVCVHMWKKKKKKKRKRPKRPSSSSVCVRMGGFYLFKERIMFVASYSTFFFFYYYFRDYLQCNNS